MKLMIAVFISLLIGDACRWFNIPAPSPNKLSGVFLVFAMTVGYVVVDRWLIARAPSASVK